jgi:hypothetical protein
MAGLYSRFPFWDFGGRVDEARPKLFFFLATAGATAVGFWALRDYRRWWPISDSTQAG